MIRFQRSADEDLWVAHMRLMSDPGITSYTMEQGVECRRPVSPWVNWDGSTDLDAAVRDALARKRDAFLRSRE